MDAPADGAPTPVPAPPSLPDLVGKKSSTEDGPALPGDPWEEGSRSKLATQQVQPPQDELEMGLIPAALVNSNLSFLSLSRDGGPQSWVSGVRLGCTILDWH